MSLKLAPTHIQEFIYTPTDMGHNDVIDTTLPDATEMRTKAYEVLKTREFEMIYDECVVQIILAAKNGQLAVTVEYYVASNLNITLNDVTRRVISRLMAAGYTVTYKDICFLAINGSNKLTLAIGWDDVPAPVSNCNCHTQVPTSTFAPPQGATSRLVVTLTAGGGGGGSGGYLYDNPGNVDFVGAQGERGFVLSQGAQGFQGAKGAQGHVGIIPSINLRTSA